MPLLPVRSRSASTARSGSLGTSAALTRRDLPLAMSVMRIAARRASRSAFRVARMSSFMANHTANGEWRVANRGKNPFAIRYFAIRPSLFHLLDEHPNGATAGQAHFPGGFVGDAEFQHLWLAALDDVERLGDHRAFDAAAGHRAEEIAFLVDNQVRADRPRRRAPGLDHGGERHRPALFAPVFGGFENVVVGREHIRLHSVVSPLALYSYEYSASRNLLHPRFG